MLYVQWSQNYKAGKLETALMISSWNILWFYSRPQQLAGAINWQGKVDYINDLLQKQLDMSATVRISKQYWRNARSIVEYCHAALDAIESHALSRKEHDICKKASFK